MRERLTQTSTPRENVQECNYSETLESCILDYSMSVIVDRAVPDVRDGLKPVQRRILYAMDQERNFHDKPYKKTAKISGLVSGNYHPHGTAGVDGAIVTMAQTFKKQLALVDGQGNFGSIEGDGAAASRYTEVRLSEFAEDSCLKLLSSDCVPMRDNYDGTLKEPEVLPAIAPLILLTGAEGIAVGMSTSIPTFNLREAVEANCYVLTHKNPKVEKILDIMPGPDFACGGAVCNPDEIEKLYRTGSAHLRVRGKVDVESEKGQTSLAVSEVPYTMVGSGMISFMQQVVDLAESKKLVGVKDVADETSEQPRMVVKLSKGVDAKQFEQNLFAMTKLEDTYAANMLVIKDGKPQVLGIVELLQAVSKFQIKTYTLKVQHDLNVLKRKESTLRAYVTCCNNIEAVVAAIKQSKSVKEAASKLKTMFELTDDQCSAVLSLRLQRLVSLEIEKVSSDLSETKKSINECQLLLGSDRKLVSKIVSELRSISKKHGVDRKTRICCLDKAKAAKVEEPERMLWVVCDRFGYVKCLSDQAYAKELNSGSAAYSSSCLCSNKSSACFLASDGCSYSVKVSSIPEAKAFSKGAVLDSVTSGKFKSSNTKVLLICNADQDYEVCCISADGFGKRIKCKDLNTSRTQVQYMPNEKGIASCFRFEKQFVQCISSESRVVKFNSSKLPVKSRSHKGARCMELISPDACIQECLAFNSKSEQSDMGTRGVKMSSKRLEKLRSDALAAKK